MPSLSGGGKRVNNTPAKSNESNSSSSSNPFAVDAPPQVKENGRKGPKPSDLLAAKPSLSAALSTPASASVGGARGGGQGGGGGDLSAEARTLLEMGYQDGIVQEELSRARGNLATAAAALLEHVKIHRRGDEFGAPPSTLWRPPISTRVGSWLPNIVDEEVSE